MIALFITLFLAGASAADSGVTKNCYIKPCQLRGDFDGDKKMDVATLVVSSDGKRGIQIKLKAGKSFVVGAGTTIGNGGDNFSWMDYWQLEKKPAIHRKRSDHRTPAASLLVGKEGAASGLIYWTGSGFEWLQQGD